MTTDTSRQEFELVSRLVEARHLSVPERKQLPSAGVKLSLVCQVIRARIESDGQFPASVTLDELFDGCLLRVDNDKWTVYVKTEVSYLQSALVDVRTFTSMRDAIDSFIQTEFKDGIDGVPIDRWA